jgi:hypothetical protein
MTRRWGRRVLMTLAPILLSVGILAGVTNREVLDGARFAQHADAVRQDQQVSQLIGVAISQQIIAYDQDLVALRPAIESIMVALVRSSTFSPIVRTAIAQVHEAFTTPGSNQVILRLADLTAVVVAALKTVAPDVASQLPPDLDVRLAAFGSQTFAARAVHATRVVDLLAWLLPALALLFLLASIALARARQRALAQCGLLVTASAALTATVCAIAAALFSAADTDRLGGAIASAAWDEVGPSFWSAALVLAIVGLVLFAAAGAYLPRWSVAAVEARAVEWIRDPGAGARPQLLSGFVLVAVGALALIRPLETARSVVILVGLAVLAAGVSRISQVSAAGRQATETTDEQRPRRSRRWIPKVITGMGVAGLVAFVVLSALPTNQRVKPAASTGPDSTACNGYTELCARRYDQVAYPATHNSMSAADEPGWFIPEQPTGLIGQLNAGVRTLLIDTWYGQATNRKGVVTNSGPAEQSALDQANAEYGPSVVQSALRLRSALDLTPEGPVEPYLCHALCALGSTKMLPVMKQVRQWVADHPRDVVTFIIEDTVSPEDTAKVFQDAGLLPFVHTQAPGQPWPTLEQMIDSGRRVQVFMQRQGGGTANPWLLKAFDWIQDTPYDNPNQAALNCSRLRGEPGNSLLLINNILTRFSTRVSDSARINAVDTFYPYASRCEQERGQIPNFLAVDYYSKGNVFRVAELLNGVG